MSTVPIEASLSLRELAIDDAEELHELISANRRYLSAWMPWAPKQTHEDTAAFIDQARRQSADDEGAHFAILDGSTIVGVVGFHPIDRANRSVNVGYWLDEQRQGNGIATRAVGAACRHAFSTWGVNRVEIRVATENTASQKLAERLSFTREGVLRQAQIVNDVVFDLAVYSLLVSDAGAWAAARGNA